MNIRWGELLYNQTAMMTLETTYTVPLTQWEDGTIRVTGSRVTLDSIVHHFKIGATAEEIVYKFPSLRLVEVYGAITYYLSHQEAVEEYLKKQEEEEEETRRLIESSPLYKDKSGIRERLLARWVERQCSQDKAKQD